MMFCWLHCIVLFLPLLSHSNGFVHKPTINPVIKGVKKESRVSKHQKIITSDERRTTVRRRINHDTLCHAGLSSPPSSSQQDNQSLPRTNKNRRGHVQELASLLGGSIISSSLFSSPSQSLALVPNFEENITKDVKGGKLFSINDPTTYSGLVYIPNSMIKQSISSTNMENMALDITKKYPVIIVLHGAGKNELDVWNLANPKGEHAGLIPSLLNSNEENGSVGIGGGAPSELYENFIVVAPYSFGKRSFYEEPRSKILQFIKWACLEGAGGVIDNAMIDTGRLFLFGFSDGATLGIELMTTNTFKGGIFAAYGFTGKLPKLALERLNGKPMWIFHSADDVIFPVDCSDRLVQALRDVNSVDVQKQTDDFIRYSRFDHDQEGFTGSVRGHSTGITASKNAEVYKWLLKL